MRPPGLPRKLTICGHEYKVKMVGANTIPGQGQQSFLKGVIALRDTSYQSPSQLRDTLLHEVLHATMAGGGLHYPGGPLASNKTEELIVRVLSTQLLDALRRNPGLAKFLLEK